MSPVRLGVIGLGLVGGSLLKRLGGELELVGFDIDESTCDAARASGFDVAASVEALAGAVELVLVAVPPQWTADAVSEALQANPHALVTDVASVKAPILEAVARKVPGELDRYLPGHPLSGAESTGWKTARPELLERTVWAVCPPHEHASPELLCRWGEVLERLDARLVVCDPLEHDMAVARTSHAPHLAAALIAGSLDGPQAKLASALSGGAFRDMTRIARSDPALWTDILGLNRDAVVAVLDEWLSGLERLRTALGDADEQPLRRAWERGHVALELTEALRWRTPQWERRSFDWPAWPELMRLGREGATLRRLELAGNRVSADVSTPPPWQTPAPWPT